MKFKGRSSLKQYLPMKPTKRGFKVWVRADSHNGFICNFDVYTGKEESAETNLGSKVVKKLSRSLVGGRYHLYFDNLFSSVSLLEDLLEDELYACATFRKDRKNLPQAVVTTTLGSSMTCTNKQHICSLIPRLFHLHSSIVCSKQIQREKAFMPVFAYCKLSDCRNEQLGNEAKTAVQL